MVSEESVQQFMAITAASDPAVARRFLAVTGSLEDAVNLFFESGEEALPEEPSPTPRMEGGLSDAESEYFAGQDRLEALRREYNSRFSIKRRLSDFIFAKEPTNALEFSNAHPRFPLALEKNALRDLLAFFPFMVEKPLLAVYLAPPRLAPAETAHIERRLFGYAEVQALLEEHTLLTAALTSHEQARELEPLGVELRRAPLLALLALSVNVKPVLLAAIELREQTDPPALLAELRACLARLAEQRRRDELFVQQLANPQPAEPLPATPSAQLAQERRLREDQERNYQQMVERHAQETAARAQQQREEERRAAEAEQGRQRRAKLARSFEGESVPAEHAITFLIRLPSGQKLQRQFDGRATFQRVHDFVASVEEKGFANSEAEFEIRSGFPPVRLELDERIAQRFPSSTRESIDVRELP